MKNELSSLDLYYLIQEFQDLISSKIDRIYNSKENKRELLISLHTTGRGKSFLKVILPGIMFNASQKEIYENPTGFCMFLRKYFEGARIKKIKQKDFERVVEIEIETFENTSTKNYFIIFELFSKGNIIICDENYQILNILEQQHWTTRELRKGEKYLFPKSENNVLHIDFENFKSIIKKSSRDSAVKSLAIDFSLGGVYAEEVCFVSNVDKSEKISNLSEKDILNVYNGFRGLFERPLAPNFCNNNILPFEMKLFESINLHEAKKSYETFSSAIEKNHTNIVAEKNDKKQQQIDKIHTIINEQEKMLIETEHFAIDNQRKGELIYENYNQINEIIRTIKLAREKYSWKDIKEKISCDPKSKELILDIDEKNKEIIIRLEK